MKCIRKEVITGFFLFCFSSICLSGTTAFQAKSAAAQIVKKEARNNLIEIYSPRSGTDTEFQWRVSFWDPDLEKVIVVLVRDGRAVDISNDYEGSFLDKFSEREFSGQDVIDPIYLQIDSDRALEIALQDEIIKSQPIDAVEFRLEKDHPTVLPVWRIKFFSHDSETEQQTAEINISADSGEILDVKTQAVSFPNGRTTHKYYTFRKSLL